MTNLLEFQFLGIAGPSNCVFHISTAWNPFYQQHIRPRRTCSGEADAGGSSRQRTALVFGAVAIDLELDLTEDDLTDATE